MGKPLRALRARRKSELFAAFAAYRWRCIYCNGPHESMEHITPLSKGGGTVADNVAPCCIGCNQRESRIVQSRERIFG